MVWRIHFIVALITALTGFASLPASAQSGRTFYIDYASGSNTNNGTSKSTPWKTHPYMQTSSACTGTGSGPTYSHVAGDRFIFKGAVIWPAACFQLAIGTGGSSTTSDYYGVDQTWFSGTSWTRPIFDMANNIPTGGAFVQVRASYIVFDNLELKRMMIQSGIGECADANMDLGSSNTSNIVIKNLYIHDWTITALVNNSTSHGTGSICQNQGGSPIPTVDNVEMSDLNTTAPVPFGACFRNLGEIKNSNCHNVGEGEVGHYGPVHDNQFHDINGNAAGAFDPANHTNILEAGGSADSPIYNNLIYNNNAGVTIFECNTANIYNNVMWNNNNSPIMVDTNCSGATSSSTANIYNNTVDCRNGFACFRYFYRSNGGVAGIVNLQDNHWITDGAATCINNPGGGCANVGGGTQSNNVTMSTNAATSQGYSSTNKYAPTSSTSGTVNAGVNLSGLCSGTLSSLCTDILHAPRLASWDAGAYQFGAQSSSRPNPPSNLTVSVQ